MSDNDDTRLRKSAADAIRGSRAAQDQQRANSEGTALTVAQRRAMLRSEFQQEALPRTPEVPGWHLCWLSTTNSYDPISKRVRLGYRPVLQNELPGFESFKTTTGEFSGCITCNEMVLFKIDMETYQMIMTEFHHEQPFEEEGALKTKVERDDSDSDGRSLATLEGFSDLARRRHAPIFTG